MIQNNVKVKLYLGWGSFLPADKLYKVVKPPLPDAAFKWWTSDNIVIKQYHYIQHIISKYGILHDEHF